MIRIQFDTNSPYLLRFPSPSQRQRVLALAQTVATYEQSLPPERQTPYTTKLVLLLVQAGPNSSEQLRTEAHRTQASEAVKRLEKEANVLIEQISAQMRIMFPTEPEQAKTWGFTVKQSTGRIHKPKTRRQQLALLSAYIEHEAAQPMHEQFTRPVLESVIRVRDELQANLARRDAGKTQRESSIAAGKALTLQMHNYLQLIAAHIVAEHYQFTTTLDLQNWGFDVVTRNGNGHSRGNGNGNGHSPS